MDMAPAIDDLQRFGLKLFLNPGTDVDVRTFVPVFHRWIQTDALEGLQIDVADYSHLSDGPCVLLAGHEGNYAIDRSEGRLGLYHYRKQPTSGTLGERLVAAGRAVLHAAMLLEADESVGSVCRFRGDEIQFVANDRLRAPVGPETTESLRPTLAMFGRRLFGQQLENEIVASDQPDRLRLTIRSTHAEPLESLLQNISQAVQK